MPFVTEEIYSMLPIKDSDSIMISTYPEYDSNLVFNEETAKVDEKVSFIAAFRNIKAENGIGKDALVKINNKDNIILKMLKIEDSLTEDELTINSYNVKSGEIEATIYYEKIVTEEEKALKEKQIADLKASIERRKTLLANENYVSKAPAALVEKERLTLASEIEALELLEK